MSYIVRVALLMLATGVATGVAGPNATQTTLLVLKYNALVGQPLLSQTGTAGAVTLRGTEGMSGVAAWVILKGTFTQDAAVGGVRNVGY